MALMYLTPSDPLPQTNGMSLDTMVISRYSLCETAPPASKDQLDVAEVEEAQVPLCPLKPACKLLRPCHSHRSATFPLKAERQEQAQDCRQVTSEEQALNLAEAYIKAEDGVHPPCESCLSPEMQCTPGG